MSGRGEGNGGEGIHAWIRGALVVVVIVAVLGVFGSQSRLERPKLSVLNYVGIAVMLGGVLLTIMSSTLAEKARADKRDLVATALRLGGVAVCVLGAIVVFL